MESYSICPFFVWLILFSIMFQGLSVLQQVSELPSLLGLIGIPQHVYTTLCLSLCLLVDILSCFLFGASVDEVWCFITISSICFRMGCLIMFSIGTNFPFPTYVISFLLCDLITQVKYKADLKKLHKPVTDMKESLIMNHVLNTSHLASSVSSIVCSRNSLFHPFATKFLL